MEKTNQANIGQGAVSSEGAYRGEGEGQAILAFSSFSALSFLNGCIELDIAKVAQATAAHPEVANARRDYQHKLACWTSNPSEGNLAAVACAAITLSSLVSYYLGSR